MRVGDATMRDGKITTDLVEKKVSNSSNQRPSRSAPAEVAKVDEGPSPFARILHGLGREVDRGETLVRRATNGATSGQESDRLTFDQQEVIAIELGYARRDSKLPPGKAEELEAAPSRPAVRPSTTGTSPSSRRSWSGHATRV